MGTVPMYQYQLGTVVHIESSKKRMEVDLGGSGPTVSLKTDEIFDFSWAPRENAIIPYYPEWEGDPPDPIQVGSQVLVVMTRDPDWPEESGYYPKGWGHHSHYLMAEDLLFKNHEGAMQLQVSTDPSPEVLED